ncbi:uncharacterized protein LOC118485911 [Helianthus annuus]|uniref:uncharacterized protein LOC118485911 n=1 Tax=Helianthus annuus TaxID=4232 RepID=UPI001652E0BA|nr:uncharacterized protein LOC118485911 [Helianthus annuus]
MNFPARWRGWIMATLHSVKASVLVNGSPTMEFVCTRGLRQGDPLSPFLFVLVMEALIGIMKKAVSADVFKVSGLKVNLSKSSIYGVGVRDQMVQTMATTLNCKKGVFPFVHLGLPVGANMNLVRNWKPVIDTFRNRLSIWKAKQLSYGGRITLLKSLRYKCWTYSKELEWYFFLGGGGGSEEKARMNWVAWDHTIAPVEYGGIVFGALKDSNQAMLAK